jgi:hypothetical protein
MDSTNILIDKINHFNNDCVKFLGWKEIKDSWYLIDSELLFIPNEKIKFDSDWNQLMQVKSKICSLDIVDEFNVRYDSVANGWFADIQPRYKNSFQTINTSIKEDEFSCVIDAIKCFFKSINY